MAKIQPDKKLLSHQVFNEFLNDLQAFATVDELVLNLGYLLKEYFGIANSIVYAIDRENSKFRPIASTLEPGEISALDLSEPPFFELFFADKPLYFTAAHKIKNEQWVNFKQSSNRSGSGFEQYFLVPVRARGFQSTDCTLRGCSADQQDADYWFVQLMQPDVQPEQQQKLLKDFGECCRLDLRCWIAICLKAEDEDRQIGFALQNFKRVIELAYDGLLTHRSLQDLVDSRETTTDGTTHLYTRTYYEKSVEKEIIRATRHWYKTSIVALEIGNWAELKSSGTVSQLSDDLRFIADVLKYNTRISDLPVRYDDARFILLLPETTSRAAVRLAHKVSELLHKEFSQRSDSPVLHFGVATVPDDAEDAAALLDQVFLFLEKARQNGPYEVVSE